MNTDLTNIQHIPNLPGVYIFKDKKDNILYIGKAKDLKKRVSQYFNPNSVWKQDMLNKAEQIDFLETKTESEAIYLEENLIKENHPTYNNLLKWDNSYAYIKITNEEFPQIFLTRNKINDWSTYIGPKHNTKELKKFLQLLRQLIKFRGCKKTQFNEWKLCGDYFFGICQGWCVFNKLKWNNQDKISQAKKQWLEVNKSLEEYKKLSQNTIKLIKSFFQWKTKPIEKEILKQIDLAIKNESFERAAKLRDMYIQIESFVEKQHVVLDPKLSGYITKINQMSNHWVYTILNFQGWRLIDIIRNKVPLEEMDIYSLKNNLVAQFGDMYNYISENKKRTKKELQDDTTSVLCINKSIPKIKKDVLNEINGLIEWFFDSYVITSSFEQENLLGDMLKDLQAKYKLKHFPYRIECIDISHLSGWWMSWWLSCQIGGVKYPKWYRRYKIKSVKWENNQSNDYLALQEVITRRFKNADKDMPSLFILDGWKGQLGVVKNLYDQNDKFKEIFDQVDFVWLGKWEARKTKWKIAGETEKIYYFDDNMKIKSIDLDYNQTDKIIIKARDEAHRFANLYRQKQMSKERK